ncbi:hypothetical protein CFC21_105195 [Triticum aestivum]|uniref:Uncharacterized protein n=2 Tax=Triticum aestivum TaxID=4565 RepID=A0A3B6SJK7_WHEAT|nr:hypothetical protein CFC21_105195 [Triticum aestivum]
MASSDSTTRPRCADQEDMPSKWEEARLDKTKEKDVKTPSCWCADECKVRVSTDRKKSWTEGRRYFVCPNYAHDRVRPTNAYDIPPVCQKSRLFSIMIHFILLTKTCFVCSHLLLFASTSHG